MEKIYIFYSEDSFLLNQKAAEIVASSNISPASVFRYDASSCNINDILTELLNASIFAEQKAIIISHPIFLEFSYTNEAIKEQFRMYFEAPSEDILLIILINDQLQQTPLVSLLKKQYGISQLAKIEKESRHDWIKKILAEEGYAIDGDALEYIVNNTSNDSHNIINELDKLKMFALQTKQIKLSDAQALVIPELEEDTFALLNAFLDRQTSKAMKIYNDFKVQNIDETRLINMIAKGILETLYVKALIANNKTKDEIAKILGISSGKAYYRIKSANKISDKELLNLMIRINKLEFHVKSGKIDKKIGFELFLLNA